MKKLLFWLIVAQGADIATTAWALRHSCSEANMIAAPHISAAYAAKAGATVAITVIVPRLHREHPKASDWMVVAPAISGSIGGVSNAYHIAKGDCR